MKFDDFIKQKKVIRGKIDNQKSRALVKMSKNNLSVVKAIPLSDSSASIILSQSYESLRQILEAIALSKGFKLYSHEAFTYFLLELNEVSISEHFDRLRKLRNGVNYYAKTVSVKVASAALQQVKELTTILTRKYLWAIISYTLLDTFKRNLCQLVYVSMKKAQTATEYLVILAVVIVIALIVVGVLGGIPSIGGGADKRANDARLSTADVGITGYSVSSSQTTLVVRNNEQSSIWVTDIYVNNTLCSSIGAFTLKIGEQRKVTCTDVSSQEGSLVKYSILIDRKSVV